MGIKSLNFFIEKAKEIKPKKCAVAAAADDTVLKALYEATKLNIIEPILIGNKEKILKLCEKENITFSESQIINEPDDIIAAQKAVSFVREGEANFLMKGLIHTSHFLKAVLDKDKGIRKGDLLSHIVFIESPYYHKIFALADAGVNIKPTFEEKLAILNNSLTVFHKLGIENPKVAVVGAVETVNQKMEDTIHAAILTQMNRRKQIKGCIIDGPLAMDNAISKEAAHHKGIISDVAGDADFILCPDIQSANIMYKTLIFLGNATSAALVIGAKSPIVLTSRADTEKSKLMSIALAALIS